jgi:hypothetical protein
MNDLNEPTLEDIKKLADSKRPHKPYRKEDRIRNLELARQKKKLQPTPEPEPEPEPLPPPKSKAKPKPKPKAKAKAKPEPEPEPETETETETETEPEPEPERPVIIMKHYKKKPKSQPEPEPEPIKKTESYDVLFNNITNLKDLIINQQDKLDTIMNKKNTSIKTPRVKKVKEPVKSLDLTITDNEIKNIVESNDKDKILEAIDKGRAYDIKNNTDVKLKAFLDAMTKKKY